MKEKPENASKKIAGISCAREGRKGGVLNMKEWHRGRTRCLARVLGAVVIHGTNPPSAASPVITGKRGFQYGRGCVRTSPALAWDAVRTNRFKMVHMCVKEVKLLTHKD